MKKVLLSLTFLFMTVSAYGKEFSQAYEDKLIQDVKGIYTQEAVKTPDNPTGHPVDATPIILQARHDFPFLSAQAKEALYPFPARPNYGTRQVYTYDSPDGYFKIHFVKDGDSAVFQPNVDNSGNGVPDYVDTCAAVLDHIWAKEIDSLGYNVPPSDGWYPVTWDNGGDGKYDIYLLNLGANYLGATHPETTSAPNPALWSYTSWIELDNNYTNYPAYHPQYDWLRVTAAHEFFHAIQFGYDASEMEVVTEDVLKPYWMEMSATWMENEVYDYINDYIYYLPAFFNRPWISLRNFDGLHPYASVVWPIYLGEKFGINIIKEIWTQCAQVSGDNVLSATNTILGNYGSTLNNAFQEFSVWNYFTGDRANPTLYGFYSEGPLWYFQGDPVKVALTNEHTLYPAIGTVNQLPEDLGATYVNFIPIASDTGGLRILFEGAKGAGWDFSLIGYRGISFPPIDTVVQLASGPSTLTGMGEVFDWWRFVGISMVIARGDTVSTQNFTYNYNAQFDTSLTHGLLPPTSDVVYQNFPNPFVIRGSNATTKFPLSLKSTSDVKLFIFTVAGELVWDSTWFNQGAGHYDARQFPPPTFTEALPFKWDGRNKHGEYVVSGIYLYRIVTNSTSTTKKLVVVNER